jgi:hypothetical protein
VKLFSFEGKNPRIVLVNKSSLVYACCYHLSFPLQFLDKKQMKEMNTFSDTNPYTNLNYMNIKCVKMFILTIGGWQPRTTQLNLCFSAHPYNWRATICRSQIVEEVRGSTNAYGYLLFRDR